MAATSVPSFARRLPRTAPSCSRSTHATRTPAIERSTSMTGSASAFVAPSASKSSRESQLRAIAPPASSLILPMAMPSRRTDASERLWNTARDTKAASAPAAAISDAARKAAASVFWYWKRPVSVTRPV